jgi:hypothetical protein
LPDTGFHRRSGACITTSRMKSSLAAQSIRRWRRFRCGLCVPHAHCQPRT